MYAFSALAHPTGIPNFDRVGLLLASLRVLALSASVPFRVRPAEFDDQFPVAPVGHPRVRPQPQGRVLVSGRALIRSQRGDSTCDDSTSSLVRETEMCFDTS